MRAKILSASAGSGKTYRLAYKFVHDTIKHYEEKPYLYRAILAVTFTNKATEEMKRRIVEKFHELITNPTKSDYMADLLRDLLLSESEIIKRAKAILTKILHDYSRFTILTIDKFFQRILRAFIKELGIDLNYNIELESSTILARSTDSLIDDIVQNEELQRWIMAFAQENMDDNGNWDIRKKMLELGKELFKEGSKQGIAQSLPKQQLLDIIGQLDKIAAKQKAEIVELGHKAMEIMRKAEVEPTDFKGSTNSFATKFAKYANGEIVEPTKTMRERALSPEGWVTKKAKATDTNIAAEAAAIELQPLLAKICDIYDQGYKHWNTLSLIKATYRSYALLQDIYEKVGHICNQEGVMLLSETKYILSSFIRDNDAPFIYEKTGNRFERFMIDEFQDTSAKEWANFVPLLQNAMAQSEDNSVLIVGDVKQSIYRWRGGDWRILQQGVGQVLGKDDTELEILSNNYRSLPRIVEFNNSAIEQVVSIDNANINAELEEALNNGNLSQKSFEELQNTLSDAYTGHSQTAKKSSTREGYIRVERYEDEPPLIECIESIIARGYSYGDIMILHRGSNDAAKSAQILLEYKQRNNAFNIMTQDSLIIGKAPISNFVIALLRLSQNPDDSISRALVNAYMNRPYSEELSQEDSDTLSSIRELTPEQAFEKIVSHYKLSGKTEEIAYLQALHEQIITYCASKVADIQLFLKYWDETGASKALVVEESDSTIELTTIHKSKGLEKKIIIIPYCSWKLNPKSSAVGGAGSSLNIVWASASEDNSEASKIGKFPIAFRKDMGASAFCDDYYREVVYSHVDNINILYVALTRACEELYVLIPSDKRNSSKADNVGALLWNAIGNIVPENKESRVEFGAADTISRESMPLQEPIQNEEQTDEKQPEIKNTLIEDYPTIEYEPKLSLASQRYFEEKCDSATAMQAGITMHKILSESDNVESIQTKIEEAVTEGTLSKSQAEELKQIIHREFQNPQVDEWFGGNWDMIRCESDIIQSHSCEESEKKSMGTLRPDRVMTKGDRAVVVDYKFGSIKAKSHISQIREYMKLLKQMGYRSIEGYIWYLTRSEIERIGE